MNKNKLKIHIDNVTKRFDKTNTVALENVSMHFYPGNLYGIIGPAGAGKTTLFRLMLGLMKPDSGTVTYINDSDNIKFNDVRECIAYMPQSQSLYSDLSVLEHLEFFRDLYTIDANEYVARKDELVTLARLEKFLARPAGKLSGGMYKKLGLMCALLRSPQIMLLDEPTNGVDPISRREFWDLLHRSLHNGITIIMSTAYMDEAERCNSVVLMENGHILGNGEPRELLRDAGVKNFDEYFLTRGGGDNATRSR